jgi:Holliday junction resolvase RusA-like endonuclease
MHLISFLVLSEPVPQPHLRVSTVGTFGWASVAISQPMAEFRAQVPAAAQAVELTRTGRHAAGTIGATFGRPRSHYRKTGVKPSAPPLPRPDVDNVGKAVLDALQDAVGDDTRVARLTISKAWGAAGSTLVTVAAAEVSGRAGGVPVAAAPRGRPS